MAFRISAYFKVSLYHLWPNVGLGQVHLKLGDWKTALANFEKVLDAHPDNCETLKVYPLRVQAPHVVQPGQCCPLT